MDIDSARMIETFGNTKLDIEKYEDEEEINMCKAIHDMILEGEQKEKFDEMMSWKNIKRVITPEDSKAAIADKGAKVICSSSGMLTAG